MRNEVCVMAGSGRNSGNFAIYITFSEQVFCKCDVKGSGKKRHQ